MEGERGARGELKRNKGKVVPSPLEESFKETVLQTEEFKWDKAKKCLLLYLDSGGKMELYKYIYSWAKTKVYVGGQFEWVYHKHFMR